MKQIGLFILAIAFLKISIAQEGKIFVASPYLQIGQHPSDQSLELLFHVADNADKWSVEQQTGNAGTWIKTNDPVATKIAVKGIEPHLVYKAEFTKLPSGKSFNYRVSKNGKVVFSATAMAPKAANQPYRCVVFGDIGAGTPEAKEIANGVYNAKPDVVVIPGDIVYDDGLISEYKTRFWPIYNADKVDTVGVPLMRSTTFIGNVGNHDSETRDLDKYPDALAYFYYFSQPLNGPIGKEGGALTPLVTGSDDNKKAFAAAAGDAFPRMANFSVDYANAHWLMLDANNYVDWTNKELTDWVTKDLAASNATWKFVVFHQPGFNSSRQHFEQQQMRALSPIFEAGHVDVVFNGHVHNYQRSFPMHFLPDNKGLQLIGGKDGKTQRGRLVTGKWTLDKTFDGKTNTKPNGIIYLVTGAGGQDLYNPEQENDSDSWQKFTSKFISTLHTFTVANVDGKTLKISQLSAKGQIMDAFTITK